MCGIMAYIGKRQAGPIILEGLKRLEYRGYDSAGIALVNGSIHLNKKKGKVSELEKLIGGNFTSSTIGIGHTRWATHGIPDDINAHPHTSNSGRVTMIHNGIFENYYELKVALQRLGFTFKSQTDTEVVVNLIEYYLLKDKIDLEHALMQALPR